MESLRTALVNFREILDPLPDPVVALLILSAAIAAAMALHRVIEALAKRFLARRYPNLFAVWIRMQGLAQLALLIIAVLIAVPVAPLQPDIARLLMRLLVVSIIACVGWAAITALNIAAILYLRRFRLDAEDNLLARKHNTQVRVLLRALDVVIVILTVAAALMTFPAVRQFGVSLFASAGVAGLVLGLAARPVLTNLLAGIQLAMTQPIRIDDAVMVEGEFGNIEEIRSTYVVVRLWDLRRMIVPLSYFIEKPFQNWTREGSELVGSVMLYLDYDAPIDAIRAKAKELVEGSPLWNGRVFAVQVTEAKAETIEVRVLMSANSAGGAFDLRCEVREKLIDFLKRKHPEALPRRRQEVVGAPDLATNVKAARQTASRRKAAPRRKEARIAAN
jgi:small-conductance mechanosensitive channel